MFIPNPTARYGEELASKYLIQKGFKIIDRNFRKGYGEIDVVVTLKNLLVFVEVKTRKSMKFGGAKFAIAPYKLNKLIQTCKFYKLTHKNLPDKMRIDAILIDLNGLKIRNFEHIQNISGF